MATESSFLEQLAEVEVPAEPQDFRQQLHARLNDWLLFVHTGDLVAGAIPYALGHFVRAVGGFVMLTLTGKFPVVENKDK